MWDVEAEKKWRDIFLELDKFSSTYYCGHKILHLVEKDLHKYFIKKILKDEPRFTFRQELGDKLRSLKRYFFPEHSPGKPLSRNSSFWNKGEILFVPRIENNLNSMIPIANGFAQFGSAVRFLLPGKARGWQQLRNINPSIRQTIIEDYSCVLNPVALKLLNSFRHEIKIFFKGRTDLSFRQKRYLVKNAYEFARKFIATSELFMAEIKLRRPSVFLTSRPKRLHPLSYIVAANVFNIPTVYVAHTTWFKKRDFVGRMYDLKSFTAAIAYTESCKRMMLENAPDLKVIVSGWPSIDGSALSAQKGLSDEVSKGWPLRVGYAAGKDYNVLRELATLGEIEGVKLLVKGHPPGGDVSFFVNAVGQEHMRNLVLWDHKEIGFKDFLSTIDVLICGKSNAGLEAAGFGIPVIGFYTFNEKMTNRYIKRIVEAPGIALWRVANIEELIRLVRELRDTYKEQKKEWISAQINAYKREFPAYDADMICREVKRLTC